MKVFNPKRFFLMSSVLVVVSAVVFVFFNESEIETPWGMEKLDEVTSVMIKTRTLERMKYVDQSGPAHHFCGGLIPSFSRYDHSIAVWALLKKFNCSQKEQIAGLFHDASHTVFSHTSDHIYMNGVDNFQDTIHKHFLRSQELEHDLKKYNITVNDLDPENPEYSGLEQPLPDMCADRIEYNIHTGILLGLISKDDAKKIIKNLGFENGKWFFTNIHVAKKFAEVSLYCTRNFWGAKWNVRANIHLAKAVKRAMEIGLILDSDLFSIDPYVIKKLRESEDSYIKLCLLHCDDPTLIVNGKSYSTEFFHPKFRGIDPLIIDDNGNYNRLSEKNIMFCHEYKMTEKWCSDGYSISILDDADVQKDGIESKESHPINLRD